MLDDICRSGVTRVTDADLCVEDRAWEFAIHNRDAIDRHWDAARAANPNYFNGVVYLTSSASIVNSVATARLFATEFKVALYWRDVGYPETGVLDGFGSALIRSSDGAVLLGRQRPGHINSGMTYLPGGFIDARDVAGDGRVDLVSSVLRELEEETGLGLADGAAAPGFILTRAEHQLSYAVTFQARAGADELIAAIMARLAADPNSELQEVVAVRRMSDLEGSRLPPYADLLLRQILASP